ncbi:MAG: lycopene beta-cyclase CrtY [Bdellovibrionaceae bacterium]|nr:lycopene beta-cyclase CrtY [Pseudobdellovibrionaceae bacterium]
MLIVGAGVAGGLMLAALRQRHPSLRVLLVEKAHKFQARHTWCFHDTDIPAGAMHWLSPFISKSWSEYEVRFPEFTRRLSSAYHCIRSEDFYRTLEEKFSAEILKGVDIGPGHPLLDKAQIVIDARGWVTPDPQPYGWQKFVGLDVELEVPHELEFPILKDVLVPQTDGYRFFYCLPWDKNSLLIEDTYYSNTPDIDIDRVTKEIQNFAVQKGWKIKSVRRKEFGSLPLALYRESRPPLVHENAIPLGARSGLVNPVTGYTLPMTLAAIEEFSRHKNINQKDLLSFFADFESQYQSQFRYLRFLNRMMFLAASPPLRYLVLQRFYRLSASLIHRFYSARLNCWHKLRLLMGKPPVPVLKALSCLRDRFNSAQESSRVKIG